MDLQLADTKQCQCRAQERCKDLASTGPDPVMSTEVETSLTIVSTPVAITKLPEFPKIVRDFSTPLEMTKYEALLASCHQPQASNPFGFRSGQALRSPDN